MEDLSNPKRGLVFLFFPFYFFFFLFNNPKDVTLYHCTLQHSHVRCSKTHKPLASSFFFFFVSTVSLYIFSSPVCISQDLFFSDCRQCHRDKKNKKQEQEQENRRS